MNITKVSVTILKDSKTLALANIVIDNDFVVNGLAVYDGTNGLWVSLPSKKNKDGEYKNICFPITKEARETIQSAVLDKFNGFVNEAAKEIYEDIEQGQKKKEYQDSQIDVIEDDLPF